MSVVPGPSASRGEIILQPTYFTSSLYVNPCRQDFSVLIKKFTEQYLTPGSHRTHSFSLFKTIWADLGWAWLHFKVFDPRARDMFINITLRIFTERLAETEPPLSRVTALFALYTFYASQPSSSAPPLHTINRIPLSSDAYKSLLSLPACLGSDELSPILPLTTHILSILFASKTFHIQPSSELCTMSPLEIPREIFVQDCNEKSTITYSGGADASSKKKGRPSKLDKQKKSKDAIGALDRWLGKSCQQQMPGTSRSGVQATSTAHVLMSHPPVTSRSGYRFQKSYLLDSLGAFRPSEDNTEDTEGQKALKRANYAMLSRLKEIDEMAANQGMEVGGEGGEKTGLSRVEKAVAELNSAGMGKRGGILSLLDGGGLGNVPETGLGEPEMMI